VLEEAGFNPLYRVAADGKPEVMLGGVWVTAFDCVNGQVVHAATTATLLPDIYSGERQLTEVGTPLDAAEPERFTATSADGSEVEAWIIRPHGFEEGRKYPLLLNVHGGPFSQYGSRFFDEFQVQAGAGYAVLYSNPRGSSGYSEEWGRAIRGPIEGGDGWGKLDYEDVMAVLDDALERFDFIDPERLGILGGSYGGFMTSWAVSHTDRFKAACSERSVNNFVLEGGSSDIGWAFKGIVGEYWFEAPDAYLQISPSTYAANITTPLLILHSEDDLRCPIGHAEDLFAILRVLKRDVEMILFPAESHNLSRTGSPAHREMRFDAILDWFGRKLAAVEEPASAVPSA
jgi:dipeptidyl aminopeptidase/acylaminoacyl peptidase